MSKSFKGGPEALETFVGRIYTKKGETARGMERGLKKAALFLQRKAQEIVPVDTGNLKNSAFTRVEGSGFQAKAIVGFTASYAIFVHENLDARHEGWLRRHVGNHTEWRFVPPGKHAKFLETPSYAYRDEMIAIIRKEAQK